jgi:RHS repeat-associated protein
MSGAGVIQTADATLNAPQSATYAAPAGYQFYPLAPESGGGIIEDTGVPKGDGSGTLVSFATIYQTALPNVYTYTDSNGVVHTIPPTPAVFPGELTRVVSNSCGSASCPSINNNAFRQWAWYPMASQTFAGGTSYWQWEPSAHVDTLGHFSVYVWDAGTPAAAAAFQAVGLQPLRELQTVLEGAIDVDGGSPMRWRNYTYEYGAAGTPPSLKQMVKTKTEPSAFGDGVLVTTTYVHDLATNRLKAVLRSGRTYVLTGGAWQRVARTIGTFYFNAYVAPLPGGLPSGVGVSPDPLNRVLEVHGPCIANAGGTDCAEAQYPLRQYAYYPQADTVNNHAGRVAAVIRYANIQGTADSCAGGTAARPLTTVITAYDARGHATSVTDENGVVTTYTYVEDVLRSKQTNGASGVTWTYGWEDDQVTSVCESVTGACEFSCYRIGATPACTGGTLDHKLQWKAKAKNSTGTPWTEKVQYTYTHGRLVSETYLASDGSVRRVVRHDADPLGRPTFEGTGTAGQAGSYAEVALFDSEGNRIAVGLPYNAAPSFCGGLAGVNDSLCAVLSYDRLNRLTTLKEAGASSGTACFRYDAEDNVSGIDLTCGDSTQGHATYQYDDFGNLSWVSGSWMALPDAGTLPLGATPATMYEYDGGGHLLRKQSPAMQAAGQWQESAYDALGRELSRSVITASGSPGPQKLFGFCYDNSLSPPTNCTTPYGKGRVQQRQDSFGLTWYQYDAFGHLTAEVRTRGATPTSCAAVGCTASGCSMQLQASDSQVNTEYGVDKLGRVLAMKYPHGRVIHFDYGDGAVQSVDRVVAVRADLDIGGTVSTQTLLSQIQWEPYGGLRAYEAEAIANASGQQQTAVEYLLGDNGSSAVSTQCNQSRPVAPGDATGRLRGLWVSAHALDGTGTGDIFKRSYQWSADQLVTQASCLLPPTTTQQAVTEYYSYDSRLRLTQASRPTAAGSKFSDTGGTFGRRSYVYTNGGERQSTTEDCWDFGPAFDSTRHELPIQYSYSGLTGSCTGNPHLCLASTNVSWGYTWDADGRLASRQMPATGTPAQALGFDSQMDASHAALGSVYRWVTVNGTPKYEYFYDADGRRRLKQYPMTGRDEFFYSSSHELLEDRGLVDSTASPLSTDAHPIDEYVWLEGRPVVLLKGSFGSTWLRRQEYASATPPAPQTTSCARAPENPDCGAYFIVTDYLKKPVALINSKRQVAGAVDYDPFGNVNRVTSLGEASNGNGAGASGAVLGFFHQPVLSTTQVQLRARYAMINTTGSDYASLYGSQYNELNVVNTSSPARNSGAVGVASLISGWVQVPANDGRVIARSTGRTGVTLLGYEYRKSQGGVAPVWIPLRFPGQYYDAETDFLQNWNRFYEPATGRYLEPEPIWSEPLLLLRNFAKGRALAVFGYASGDPIATIDPTGRDPFEIKGNDPVANEIAARAIVKLWLSPQFGAKIQAINDSNYKVTVDTSGHPPVGFNGVTYPRQDTDGKQRSDVEIEHKNYDKNALGVSNDGKTPGLPTSLADTVGDEIGHAVTNFEHQNKGLDTKEVQKESARNALDAENIIRQSENDNASEGQKKPLKKEHGE